MPPKHLINKFTKVVFDFTPDLATNTDLEPYYGDEEEAPAVVSELESADGDIEDVVDPDTGEIIVTPPAAPKAPAKPKAKTALKKGAKK